MEEIKIKLSPKDEIGLQKRYGRRNNPETLVRKAIAEVLKQQAEDVPVFVGKEEHEARLKAAEVQRAAEEAARQLSPDVAAGSNPRTNEERSEGGFNG